MKIAVFGTGIVGRTVASPRELGHDVAIGTRDPRPPWPGLSPDAMGNPPLAQWQSDQAASRHGPVH